MAIFTRARLALAISILLFACFAFLFWWAVPARVATDVPCFPTIAGGSGLALRYIELERNALLIAIGHPGSSTPFSPSPARVYRYEADGPTFSKVDAEQWNRASGTIMDDISLRMQRRIKVGDWRIGISEGEFLVGKGALPTTRPALVGAVAFRAVTSPLGSHVAVLTAIGRQAFASRGWFAPRGGGGYLGQHFIEVLALPDLLVPQKSIRIPFAVTSDVDSVRWSEDGRYLVVSSASDGKVCIVDIGAGL